MGRKWSNIKFSFRDRNEKIPEASANRKTQHEALEDYIHTRWDKEFTPSHQNVDVTYGRTRTDWIESILQDLADQFTFLEKAAVISVSDSTNAGSGVVYDLQDGSVTELNKFSGYQGAFGEDVAGKISEEYRIHVSPEWLW